MKNVWGVLAAALFACGPGRGGSPSILPPAPPPDASVPADAGDADPGSPDAGQPDAGQPDAGQPDAGPADAGAADAGAVDAGPAHAGPADAGPAVDAGTITVIPTSAGWQFASDGLPGGNVFGASADEEGNLWVAGGSSGVFVQQ